MKKISIFILSICAATTAFLIGYSEPEPEQIEPVEIIEVPYIIEKVQVDILIAALPPIIEPIVILEEEEENMKTVNEEDLRLLSSIIFAEAGNQCYAGKLGVGIVVMNRVKSEDFPNTIKEVIYQKKPVQFSPTKNGSYEEALELYDNNEMPEDCILAALSAMDNVTIVEYKSNKYDLKDYLYFGRKTKGYKLQIGLHQFK